MTQVQIPERLSPENSRNETTIFEYFIQNKGYCKIFSNNRLDC